MSSTAGRHQPAPNAAAPVWSSVPSPCAPKRAQSSCPCCRTGTHGLWAVQGEHVGAMSTVRGASQGAEGEPLPRAFREATFPMDFLHPVGFVPFLQPAASLSIYFHPLPRGVSQLRVGTPGQGRRVPEQWPQRALAPGGPPGPARPRLQQGEQGLCTAQQQRPPTARLARILETHVECRERKKAAELPRNYC